MSNHNPMNIATDFAKATGGTARKVVALTDKGPLNGFKKFLSRGSMIDMAVGAVSYTHLLLADEAGTGASALTEAPASIATLTKDDLLNLLG